MQVRGTLYIIKLLDRVLRVVRVVLKAPLNNIIEEHKVTCRYSSHPVTIPPCSLISLEESMLLIMLLISSTETHLDLLLANRQPMRRSGSFRSRTDVMGAPVQPHPLTLCLFLPISVFCGLGEQTFMQHKIKSCFSAHSGCCMKRSFE